MSSGSSKESRRSATERREAATALRQQQEAAERRRRTLLAGGGVLVVLIVLGVVVGIGLSQSNKNTSGPATAFNGTISAPSSSVVDSIGAGGGALAAPKAISAPTLTVDGKVKIVYVGAEWCPYCAAQRWVIADALARFGTFKNLGQTQSSSTDVDPSTHTLSFHGSTYTSDYIDFTGNEIEDNQRQPLDKLSAADSKIFATYNTPTYTSAQSPGTFPFMDIGGTYILAGAMYDPGVLAGLTQKQILADMKDANSPVAQAIVGSANVLTATICKLTNNKPANVCTAAGVRAAAGA
jgi:hypothetical protein